MNETTAPLRVPAGVRAGGQFAPQVRTEADVALMRDRDGHLVTPAHPDDGQWFLVHDDAGAHARHVSEIAWPHQPDDERVELMAGHIEASLVVGWTYDAQRIAERLNAAGIRAPHSPDAAANTEVLRALVWDTFDEGWSPLTCARDLARAGVRCRTDDEP